VLRLLGVVISIGLADSMNPSTIAPGLYLASGRHPRSALIQFTLGVFGVNFVGGAIVALGPGQALLALVPHPSATTRYILELVAGVVMLIAAVVLWQRRGRLSQRQLPSPSAQGKSSAMLGATIAAIELPTAFPYFAAIAAIVGSGLGPGRQIIALAVYNTCFVLPLILMILTITIARDQAGRILNRARELLQRHWPALLAGLALVAGAFVLALGVTGLTSGTPGTVGRLSRRFRRAIH
jgi:cytochrome c biogenesis protein CcdA